MTKPSKQSEAAAAVVAEKAATATAGRGVEATEEQARAIIATAKRAVEEAKTIKNTRADGAPGRRQQPSSSMKRSLQCFLEGRKSKSPPTSAVATIETSTASSSSSSSN